MQRSFRRLNVSDLDMVLRMNDDFRQGFVCAENARVFLSDHRNWLFACLEDSKIIGFCYGYELNRLNDIGNMLYIHEVGVLPDYQRQGIGKTMLESIKTLCRLSGVCRFFLVTEKSNKPACALYNSARGTRSHDDDVVYFFNDLGEAAFQGTQEG